MTPFTSHSTLRPLRPDDLDAAIEVVRASGLSTAPDDLVLHASLDGVRAGAWSEGRLVGVAGALRYGDIGIVGPMSVLPEQQGRGIGALLLRYVLDWLRRAGAGVVTLDATPSGAPLYRKHGFVTDHHTILLVRQKGPGSEMAGGAAAGPAGGDTQGTVGGAAQGDVRPITPADVAELARFDTPAFGASRHALLARYAGDAAARGVVLHGQGGIQGYAFRRLARLGPFVALDRASAAALLDALSLPRQGVVTTTAPESNQDALSLLSERGFTESRRLERMRLGGVGHPGDPRCVYGIASFAFG